MTYLNRIALPDDGKCPCGCPDLVMARDFTEYAPQRKDPKYGWQSGGTNRQQASTDDPLGNVRLFCTTCGEYFFIPEELQ